MTYNGLGQRISMDASGVIAYYVMDGNKPLTAESNGNDTTTYLYGLGVIGEENTTWSYSLSDGTNTQRQLTDSIGEVTYSARYTPWGDTLESAGTGNFTFGYFGGLMDEATGLMYVGNGQYYDPSTGRFLTRGNSNSTNPYLPFDPTGALFVPLAFASLMYGKKKKKSKLDVLVIIALVSLSAGLGVAACGGGQPVNFTATVVAIPGAPTGIATIKPETGGTVIAPTPVQPDGTPTILVIQETPCATPTSTPTPNDIVKPLVILACGAGNNPCGASEYGLSQYKSWADGKGFKVKVEGFSDFIAGSKEKVASNIIDDVKSNPEIQVVFIGHSAGADSIIIAFRQIPTNITVSAIALLDPALYSTNSGNLTIPPGDNIKVYDTAYDGINILPSNQQLDQDLLARWPNEGNLHQALAKDEVVKDDVIAFIEERLR